MPFFAAVFGYLFLGERVDLLRAVSLIIGAAGIYVLAQPFLPVIRSGELPVGLLYVLGAAMFWAGGTVYSKRFPIEADALAISTWQLAVGALVCLAGVIAFETPRLGLDEPRVLAAFAYHVLLPQSVAYALWFTIIKAVSASTATLGTLLIPIFGVTGSMMVLGEQPSATDFLGFGLMLAAVVLDQIVRVAFLDRGPAAPRS
jgi:drug/metabolite transporter (DMT)-like permease